MTKLESDLDFISAFFVRYASFLLPVLIESLDKMSDEVQKTENLKTDARSHVKRFFDMSMTEKGEWMKNFVKKHIDNLSEEEMGMLLGTAAFYEKIGENT